MVTDKLRILKTAAIGLLARSLFTQALLTGKQAVCGASLAGMLHLQSLQRLVDSARIAKPH